MSALRVVLVTRRFWPLVGGAEVVMANLGCELQSRGARVTILTARWEPDWPSDVVHREVPVVRLPNPRQRGWGTVRYMSGLARWLRTHRGQYDVVYVSMLKHDAYAAIGALAGTAVPVVLRAEGAGETGDCHWQRVARFGSRIRRRCMQAAALVAPSEAIAQEMRAADYPPDKIHQIPNGVSVGPPRDAERQRAARAALAEVNHDLELAPQAPAVVYTGRLDRAKGLLDLVQAWVGVSRRWPDARLWLVGEGPLREELYQRIGDLELRGRVLLPGAFDDVADVLQAADAFVIPSYQEGMSLSLLEAMASGLPVVASDIPANRKLVADQQHGLLAPVRNAAALERAIVALLDDPPRAAALGHAAQQHVAQHFSLQRMAEAHLSLFDHLL